MEITQSKLTIDCDKNQPKRKSILPRNEIDDLFARPSFNDNERPSLDEGNLDSAFKLIKLGLSSSNIAKQLQIGSFTLLIEELKYGR